MFDNIFYDFHHVTPAIIANEIAFNQAEEMHRMACQQAEDNDYDYADFAATEAYIAIARLRAKIEN